MTPTTTTTKLTHADVLGSVLKAVYTVASRRTTQSFAATVIGAIIKTLEQNYKFLKYINIGDLETNTDDTITISPEINQTNKDDIGRVIEEIIRIVYMDLVGKAGLFFLKELKEQAGETIVEALKTYNVDLTLLQTEQRYLHRQHRRKTTKAENDVSLLGYTWKNVGSWKFDPLQKTCVLYDKEGHELDRLDLGTIIESYVTHLTHEDEPIPTSMTSELNITDKEIELLKMLSSQDMDAETATKILHVSKNEFETMVSNLVRAEMLHYVSYNEIELTEEGMNLLNNHAPHPQSI
jgi:hypothetical protein